MVCGDRTVAVTPDMLLGKLGMGPFVRNSVFSRMQRPETIEVRAGVVSRC